MLSEDDIHYIIGFYRDLSDRIRWEKVLSESENRYRTLFNSVKEGIILVNPSSNKIHLVNTAVCDMLGYSEDELIGNSFSILNFNFEDSDSQNTYHSNLLCRHKFGGLIYVDLRTSDVHIDNNNFTAYYFTDVTERKRSSEQFNNIFNLGVINFLGVYLICLPLNLKVMSGYVKA